QTISNVLVHLTSPDLNHPGSVTADDGKFSFANLPLGLDYILEPERNDDHKNGVSTLDLVRIQKHLLGKEVFTSPYQYIAADANNSKSVSAIDLLEIRKLILGIYQEYPDNESWRFVKKDQELIPGNPWPFDEKIRIDNLAVQMKLKLDFIGVKIGDVNNTVKAHATQILPRSGNQIVSVKGSVNGEISKDEVIEIRLVIPEIVNGFQWTLETDGLEYIGTYSNDIHIDENNVGVLNDGILTMSWNGELSEMSKGKNEISISIQLRVIEAGPINQMIRMNSTVTKAEAYSLAGEIKETRLAFDHKKSVNDFALYQNKPNPWNGMTIIGFDLPADASATLTVYDVASKIISTINGEFKAGYNTIMLNEKDIPGTGVLYYRLESGEYAATKKMILIR
ncbi:MAG: dockerin type I domain-containing protein, partial [Saprospiraceae bacterium]